MGSGSQSTGAPGSDASSRPTGKSTTVWVAAEDGTIELRGISARRQAFDRSVTDALNALFGWMEGHWLLILNVALALLVGAALLVPVLFAVGWAHVGRQIFIAYHTICAQIPSHSYFLLGYQVALCARNLAIFGSLLAGTLAFRYMRNWLPPLDWRLWMMTMLPMAWDGGTQLFGWRESTWELRTLTGAIFGLGVCWFVLPLIQQAATAATSRSQSTALER